LSPKRGGFPSGFGALSGHGRPADIQSFAMRRSLAALLLFTAFASAQEPPKKPAPPEPFAVDVSGAAWEPGELRTCSTYFLHPKFLLCDDDVRMKILDAIRQGNEGRIILAMKVEHSKRFLVQFSQLPWRLATPDPDKPSDEPSPVFVAPTSGSRDLESQWDCSKEKTITCKFLKSF